MFIFFMRSNYRWRYAEWFRHRHHHLRHRKHHRFHVVLFVNGVGEVLNAGQESKIMITLTLGHNVECSLAYLDANGNPMLATPTPDAPATWTNTTPATETLIASADGNTCEATTLAVGTDSISVSVTVGGKTFVASVAVEVDAAPQVLTSVAINTVASP